MSFRILAKACCIWFFLLTSACSATPVGEATRKTGWELFASTLHQLIVSGDVADPARVANVLAVKMSNPKEFQGSKVIGYLCKADCGREFVAKHFAFELAAPVSGLDSSERPWKLRVDYIVSSHWQVLDGGGSTALEPSESLRIEIPSPGCLPTRAVKDTFSDSRIAEQPQPFPSAVPHFHPPAIAILDSKPEARHKYQMMFADEGGCVHRLDIRVDDSYFK